MVLPVPVCAMPTTFRPAIITGNALCWMVVGCCKPISVRALNSGVLILRSEKVNKTKELEMKHYRAAQQ